MRRRIVFAIITVGLAAASVLHAEVSVPSSAMQPGFLVMGGSEDPWPFPTVWALVRAGSSSNLMLNESGDLNGDGPAAACINPSSHAPHVIWSRHDGSDREIVVSRWLGFGWSSPIPLTSNSTDDLDPSFDMSNAGATHASWWRSDGVFYAVCGDLSCGSEEAVDVGPARRPSLVLYNVTPVISFERTQGSGTEVRVSMRFSAGWESTMIALETYLGPRGDGDIDVQVHRRGDLLWIDWVHGDHMMAYSVYDPVLEVWSAPEQLPYTWDPAQGTEEWIAREMARVEIRLSLLRGE